MFGDRAECLCCRAPNSALGDEVSSEGGIGSDIYTSREHMFSSTFCFNIRGFSISQSASL
jgi:hypothetical protein